MELASPADELVKHHPDDITVCPDGTWTTLGEIHKGNYQHMSDDYEIVSVEDTGRLTELRIDID